MLGVQLFASLSKYVKVRDSKTENERLHLENQAPASGLISHVSDCQNWNLSEDIVSRVYDTQGRQILFSFDGFVGII